jgi:hypothetical protein
MESESTDLTERIRARKAKLEAEAEASQGFPGKQEADVALENEQLRKAYRESGRIQHRA